MSDERSNEPRSADQWYSAMKAWTRDRNRLIARAQQAESQNQALQERLDRQEVYISKEIPALQERAEKWSLFEAWYAESRWMGGPQWDALEAALPTQETWLNR
jgi:hypothetical protein